MTLPSGMPFNPRKILLIRPRYIGDVLLSSALVRTLRIAFPHAELDYLTTPSCAEMLHGNPHVDRVLWYPAHDHPWQYVEVARRLYRANYDVVVDLEGARSTARLTWATQAPVRIGYDARTPRWAYTHPVPTQGGRRYWVLAQGELLRPLGVLLDSARTELFLNDADRAHGNRILTRIGIKEGQSFAVMTPGSAHRYNVWPAERFAQVADRLATERDLDIVLLFGPGQKKFATDVQEAMRCRTRGLIAMTPTMRDAAAVLERSAMYVGADTGTRHVAIALGVPTVGIFGRQYAERWTPPDASGHLTVENDPGCKHRCKHRACAHLSCIRGIPASRVADQVSALLSSPAGLGRYGLDRREAPLTAPTVATRERIRTPPFSTPREVDATAADAGAVGSGL